MIILPDVMKVKQCLLSCGNLCIMKGVKICIVLYSIEASEGFVYEIVVGQVRGRYGQADG